ncbi:STAS domain-containing protein [Cryptosporangium phraense]|nr:STAS domain-containing protein [Cryptosporangium phraense]
MIPIVSVRVVEAFTAAQLPLIRAAVEEVLAVSPRVVVLELDECPAIDAAGVAYVVDLHRRLRRDERRLEVHHPTERVRRVLTHLRLDRILPVRPAASSLDGDAPAAGAAVVGVR